MGYYRKKPILVEAFQFTKKERLSNEYWPEWLHRAWNLERTALGAAYPTVPDTSDGTISINTLEGPHVVNWGNYIIRGVKGELYPCDPDIFALTYDEVSL